MCVYFISVDYAVVAYYCDHYQSIDLDQDGLDKIMIHIKWIGQIMIKSNNLEIMRNCEWDSFRPRLISKAIRSPLSLKWQILFNFVSICLWLSICLLKI